jgi:glycosyltransferase involved in cell wall biosynthesis
MRNAGYNSEQCALQIETVDMDIPRISVVMPVYNCEKYLDEAISSILDQTFDNFELIVINDGSTDRTDEIARRYSYDGRLIYESNHSNMGIVYCLNRGLELSRADLVARMDGDDIAAPNRLEVQLDFLEKNEDIVLVGSFIEIIDEEGNDLGSRNFVTGPENIKRVFFYYGPHRHPTVMFRKGIIEKIGRYRKEYELIEDVDLYFRLILSGYKTDNIPTSLLKYRVHPEASDKRFKEKGMLSFRLKKEIVKELNVRLGPINYGSIYVHYLLDRCLSVKRKHQVESFIKSAVDLVLSKRESWFRGCK